MPREIESPEEKRLFHLLTMARTANNMMLEVTREIIRMYEEERKKSKPVIATPEDLEREEEARIEIMKLQAMDSQRHFSHCPPAIRDIRFPDKEEK